MLFGMLFGAGNLIFPIQLGQEAGANMIPATLGFLITAIGLPFLGVVAIQQIKKWGIQGNRSIALGTVKSGVVSVVLMCVIYGGLA